MLKCWCHVRVTSGITLVFFKFFSRVGVQHRLASSFSSFSSHKIQATATNKSKTKPLIANKNLILILTF